MNKIAQTILNLAAGKFKPIEILSKHHFLVNVDTMYYEFERPDVIEYNWRNWGRVKDITMYCNEDAFTFMERTKMLFDQVCIYRFLEHVSMDKVLYFIYLVSTVTKPGSLVDVIVPNYAILAEMILGEYPTHPNFDKQNVELTTELLNEPSCPHASIWTDHRAKHFWEFEKRFKVVDICNHYDFDGRDIYLRFWAERI